MPTLRGALLSIVIGLSTAVVIIALAILPFLAPPWVGFEQGRAQAAAWTGFTDDQLHAVTDSVLHDLVLGPPDFLAALPGQTDPVLKPAERAHMRDVHSVLSEVAVVVAAAALVLLAGWRLTRKTAFWNAVRTGGAVLGVGVAALGVMSVVAFDAVFELMHRLLFPAGTYAFEPSSRLLQLFPEQLFFESGIALGAVLIVLAVIVVMAAGRLARRAERGSTSAEDASLVVKGGSG